MDNSVKSDNPRITFRKISVHLNDAAAGLFGQYLAAQTFRPESGWRAVSATSPPSVSSTTVYERDEGGDSMLGLLRGVRLALGLVAAIGIAGLFAPQAEAKLTVLPPDKMIEQADIIATGTVAGLAPGSEDELNSGTIELDAVLKGHVGEAKIVLKETRYMTEKSWLQRIPPVGTKVFVLLATDEEGKPGFFADGNQIAVMDNDRVTEVYKGINTSTVPYAAVYDAYYQRIKDGAYRPRADRVSEGTQSAAVPVRTGAVQTEASAAGAGAPDAAAAKPPLAGGRLALVVAPAAALLLLAAAGLWRIGRHRRR